ncbi:MFS transporter [Nocardia sp. NBC_01499]|uniref:MFS transporter n=1 Tax=Nocardia sp. NBC_01499 TaxID=2903597 RepID=UPI0038693BB6
MSDATDVHPATKSSIYTPVVLVCCASFFLITLDATIVNSALYSIQLHWSGSIAAIQWIVDSYTIVLAALMLSTGALADRVGAHRLLVLGLWLFMITSAACGSAPMLGLLIAFRVAQGIGAATMLPASLALLTLAVVDRAARVKATSLWAAAGGIAVAAGPVLGGALTTWIGWRTIFLINIPVCAICLFAFRTASFAKPAIARRFDPAGQLLATVGLVALTGGVIEFRGDHRLGAVLCGAGVVSLVLFLVVESKIPHAAIPTSLWRNRVFDSCVATGFALNFAYFGSVFVLGLLVQQVFGYSPALGGATFIPLTIFITASNLFAGKLIARFGAFTPLMIGQLLEAAGFFAVAYGVHTQSMPTILIGMVPIGVGAGTASPPMMSTLMNSVAPSDSGLAAGALNCLRQIGTVLGVAVFGVLIANNIVTGAARSLVASGAILVFTAALTTLFIPRGHLSTD